MDVIKFKDERGGLCIADGAGDRQSLALLLPWPEIVHNVLVLPSPVYWKRVIGTVHLLHGCVEADGWGLSTG